MKLTQLTATSMVACILGLLVLLAISLLSLASIRANQQSFFELAELKQRADNFSVASDSLLLFDADTSLWQAYKQEGRSLQSTLQAMADTVPGTDKAAHHVKIIMDQLDDILAADVARLDNTNTTQIQNQSHGPLSLNHRSQIILNNIANHGIALDTALSEAIIHQRKQRTQEMYRTSLLFAGSALLFAIVSMIAFVLIYQRVNQPTRTLLQTIKSARADELDARVAVSGRDELAEIGQAFNDLLDYQQIAQQRLQQQQSVLNHQRQMLEESQRIARLGSWRRDIDSGKVEWSDECYRIVGRSPDSFTPSTQAFFDMVHPDDIEALTALRDIALTGKQPLDKAVRIVLPDGTLRHVHLWAELKYDNNGKPCYLSGSLQDVSEFHALVARLEDNEQALRASRDELADALALRQTLINSLPAHIALLDADGRILDVNDQWRHFGEENAYTDPGFGIGQSYIEICNAATDDCREDALAVAQGLKDVLAHKQTTFAMEYPCHSPDTKRWFRVMINQLISSQSAKENYGAVVMHVDITERKLAEVELNRLVFEDQLTGVWSRIGFVARLSERISQNGWPAHGLVVLLDIEQLHDVNDAHGYAVGDQLLIHLAGRFRAYTGDDGLVGRTGGDQFMLYVQAGSESELKQQLVALESIFSAPFRFEDQLIYTNAHFGYTLLATDIRDVEALIREAELALFETRQAKSGRWRMYKTEFDTVSQNRVRLGKELRQALANQEFELHFQPKVNLINGELIACEALLRWHHPEYGLQPPANFIPVAEQSQLIRPIGHWVLNEACRYLRRWSDEGLPIVSVSVNVSLVQFIDQSFTESVAAALADHQVEAGSLILEITESVFDEASGIIKAEILKLHEMGVRLSLDDFGTGYSSLRYLQQYPFDEIKIDQSFVRNLVDNMYSRSIVSATLDIAKAIGAEVVAEGIENLAVRNALLDLGCKSGQGYYFSMPLEAEDFHWLLNKGSSLPLTASDKSKMIKA